MIVRFNPATNKILNQIAIGIAFTCVLLIGGCDNISLNKLKVAENSSLPSPTTIIEKSTQFVSSPCATTGGFRLIHGLDYNHDGKLSPYERQHEDFVCTPPSTSDISHSVATLPR